MNQPQPTTNKDRCELCSYFHTSERCPNINAKRDPKWGEWDKSLKARPLAIFNGGKPGRES